MPKFTRVALLFITACAAFNLQAATVSYQATEAVSDGVYHNGSDHALWIPKLAGNSGNQRDWVFDGNPGLFQIFDDGSAQFSGEVVNQANNAYTGSFVFDFSASPAALAIPKLELNGSAYAPAGPVDPSTWDFFDTDSGSFSGSGILQGLELTFSQRPDPSNVDPTYKGQLGNGANGKNTDFGFSSWFYWSIIGCVDAASGNNGCAPLGLHVGKHHYGDININLSAVPLPAAVWLFASALLGLFGWRRGQAKAV